MCRRSFALHVDVRIAAVRPFVQEGVAHRHVWVCARPQAEFQLLSLRVALEGEYFTPAHRRG